MRHARHAVKLAQTAVFAAGPTSPAGLTRGSSFFAKIFTKKMDGRVKPGHDPVLVMPRTQSSQCADCVTLSAGLA